MNKNHALGGFGLLGLIGILLLFLPVTQTIAYSLFVQTPAFWYWLIIGVVAAGVVGLKGYETAALAIFGVSLVMAVAVGPMLSGVYAQQHIQQTQEFDQMNDLPDTSEESMRVVPRAVADQYAQSSMQYPVYKRGGGDITYHNGTYTWSYGLIPDRLLVALQGNQMGSMYVNMETSSKDVDIQEKEMENGQGQLFTDSYAYKLNQKRLDVDHRPGTAFNFIKDGDPYIAQSYVTHEWRFKLTPIPQPYTVPKYGGTLVIDGDGDVKDLSPSEVSESGLLKGQNTYPYELAMFRVKSEQYVHGIWNALFIGEDVPQIADVPAQGNKQPFTVPTRTDGDLGLTYFIAAEPSGSGNGVYKIYTVDSQTGTVQQVEYDDTQIGPTKAANFVRKENPRVNWAEGESGTMAVSELIPVVRDGTLYWKASIVPTDSSGIAYTAFVNAETGTVSSFDNDLQIYEFVREGEVVTHSGGENQSEESSGLVVAVLDENGTVVDTVEVPENGSVEVNQTSE